MGGKSGKKQTVGYRYFMSLHMGLCRGPVDEIVQIDVGDVRAWPIPDGESEEISGLTTIAQGPNGLGVRQYEDGSSVNVSASQINTVASTVQVQVSASQLFGGDKKEGGIAGTLNVLMGADSQIIPTWIKNLLGGRVPEFRGVVTLFFDGLLTSLNPYPKKWTVRVRRTQTGWDGPVWQPTLGAIWMRNGMIKGMNGAHILYECLTNRDWGRGLPRSVINDARWTEAATRLYDENFGLCLRYNRQSDLSEFIQNVLDHIGGSIYADRATGELSLDLLRGDYNVNELPLFTYDSGLISLEDDETAAQEDLINEVIVKWTDPIAGKERSARVHDLAAHQSMGAANSSTTTLAGIPTADLALRVGQRNLKAGTNALKRYKLTLDRRAWRMVTGDVFRISVPDRDIFNAVLRAGEIRSMEDGKITVKAVLDVFGMPATSFIDEQPAEWTPLSRSPVVAERRLVREATYAEMVVAIGAAETETLDTTAGAIITFAAKPSAMSQGYNLLTRAQGSTKTNSGAGTFAPAVTLADTITPLQTEVPFTDAVDLGLVEVGDVAVFNSEICKVTGISAETSTITLARGCVDTIPRSHVAGEQIFIVSAEVGGDEIEYVAGETVDVQVLPYTSTAELSPDLAPTDSVLMRSRQGRPYPPGNVRVNGATFDQEHVSGGDIILTWAHRNRVTQQEKLVAHPEPSIAPEPGTFYRIRVYDGNTSTVLRTADTTGATYTYTSAMAAGDGTNSPWFELETLRGPVHSLNIYRFGTAPAGTTETLVLAASGPGSALFAGGAYTRIPLYTEANDSESAWSSNNRYTVPLSGDYRIALAVTFAGATTPLANGSTWKLKWDSYGSPASGDVAGQTSTGAFDGSSSATLDLTLPLTAGEIDSIYLHHSGGGNITVAAAVLNIYRIN